jgi:hypothetical protein
MRQIRQGVFETNSSSTHSLTMCLASEYEKWENGEVLLCTDAFCYYSDETKPEENRFYTRNEAIGFIKYSKYCPKDIDWDNEKEVDKLLNDKGFRTYDKYDNDYLEWRNLIKYRSEKNLNY